MRGDAGIAYAVGGSEVDGAAGDDAGEDVVPVGEFAVGGCVGGGVWGGGRGGAEVGEVAEEGYHFWGFGENGGAGGYGGPAGGGRDGDGGGGEVHLGEEVVVGVEGGDGGGEGVGDVF